MKNFPFEHEGKTLWFSRSVACTMYLFVCEINTGRWYVLISKRGPGCPSAVGLWNVPGGYLDFNETLEEAARRECYEETGVTVNEDVKLAAISTNPHSERQNVVCSFYAVKYVDDIINIHFSREHNENQEVDDIRLVDMREFENNFGYYVDQMAFGHEKMIREIYRKRIRCGMFKKMILEFFNKYLNINLTIQ